MQCEPGLGSWGVRRIKILQLSAVIRFAKMNVFTKLQKKFSEPVFYTWPASRVIFILHASFDCETWGLVGTQTGRFLRAI